MVACEQSLEKKNIKKLVNIIILNNSEWEGRESFQTFSQLYSILQIRKWRILLTEESFEKITLPNRTNCSKVALMYIFKSYVHTNHRSD